MLANYAGEKATLKGVSIYLKNHLFGSTTTHDLWVGITEATGVDIASFMENWITKVSYFSKPWGQRPTTHKMGFPVLTVRETGEGIAVRQDRFFETGAADESQNGTLW